MPLLCSAHFLAPFTPQSARRHAARGWCERRGACVASIRTPFCRCSCQCSAHSQSVWHIYYVICSRFLFHLIEKHRQPLRPVTAFKLQNNNGVHMPYDGNKYIYTILSYVCASSLCIMYHCYTFWSHMKMCYVGSLSCYVGFLFLLKVVIRASLLFYIWFHFTECTFCPYI